MDVYAALELGERFLPRPTTTFTKRRLYCWVETRGGRVVSVAISVRIRAAYAETLQILAGWVGSRQHADAVGERTLRRLMARPLGSFFLSCLATLGV